MTMRQIQVAVDKIEIRVHNDRAFEANLHGVKMKFIDPTPLEDCLNLTEEQKAELSEGHEEYLEKLRSNVDAT